MFYESGNNTGLLYITAYYNWQIDMTEQQAQEMIELLKKIEHAVSMLHIELADAINK